MIINWEKARNITGGDPVLYKDLWNMILESMDEKTDAIRAALKKKDWADLEFAVHKLKGALRNVAAEEACGRLQEMEDLAKAGEGQAVQEKVKDLDSLLSQVIDYYNSINVKNQFEEK